MPEAISAAVCSFPHRAARSNRDRDHPVRHAGGAHRAPRRAQMDALQPLLQARPIRGADPVLRVPRHEAGVAEQAETVRRSPRDIGGADFHGRPGPRSATSSGRRATTPTTPPWRCGPAPRASSPTSACRSRAWPSASPRPSRTSRQRACSAPIVGHVGDGNFHLILLVDPTSRRDRRAPRRLNERLVERALALGGTCTGEHGVGYGKLEYLERRARRRRVDVMRTIKQALDPHNILNPGKIVSLDDG